MMEKFTFIDYNQFSSFMQNKDFQANNIVFWTGAGIDCDTPTCLPLGAALTEKILSWTCGDMGAELFKKCYYLEASSIAGLIGNLNAGLFMAIIEKMRNAGIADELILFYYDAASRLCDIAGTKRYARFKDKLWTFYKRVSCEW